MSKYGGGRNAKNIQIKTGNHTEKIYIKQAHLCGEKIELLKCKKKLRLTIALNMLQHYPVLHHELQ